jgi:cellulose synthase/poly-beta-1,6-N-acetylglucosamine synthase-like glycosyltransferase
VVELCFWLSAGFIGYVYFGYPVLLMIWRRLAARPVKKTYHEPPVTIVIAAHDERQRLERKLKNCLALDYPKSKLQTVVSLDGPTDGSERLVEKYSDQNVEMVHSKEHTGKAGALNRAMKLARGEIVVFADVRQTFANNAIRELVANFADESVGAVSGELMLSDEPGKAVASDVGLYWRYEKAIRSLESDIHSVAGATGAIYAIRRELYEELPAGTLLDDVLTPMRIVLKGKRTLLDPAAKAYDQVACCPLAEYPRKVRTLAGNYQLVKHCPESLLPWRNPIFVQFASHKLGRLLVPWALLVLLASNLLLLRGLYVVTLLLQVAWYACASAGYFMSTRALAAPGFAPEEDRKAA